MEKYVSISVPIEDRSDRGDVLEVIFDPESLAILIVLQGVEILQKINR